MNTSPLGDALAEPGVASQAELLFPGPGASAPLEQDRPDHEQDHQDEDQEEGVLLKHLQRSGVHLIGHAEVEGRRRRIRMHATPP